MATKEVQLWGKVDPADEPSAEWGWHGTNWKVVQAGGWVIVVALLAMTIGNHEGRVGELWLIGVAGTIVIMLLLDLRKRRTAWRN